MLRQASSREWKLSPGQFGPVFAAVLVGAMLGAFLFGYAADKLGRKQTLTVTIVWFGVLNIASAYATSIEQFTLLRFLCGIGLGGAIPNVMALVSEYAPARKRATLVAIAWCGFGLGAVLGGIISVPLIQHFGWRSVFIFGGILPLCLVPFAVLALPESIKFLMLSPAKGHNGCRYPQADRSRVDSSPTTAGLFSMKSGRVAARLQRCSAMALRSEASCYALRFS